MVDIIPAILTNDPNEVRQKIQKLQDLTERVQIDVIDGKFADNKTVDIAIFDSIETSLRLDFHLMVDEPINWVERCIRAGADRIIGHIELMTEPLSFLAKCQSMAIGAGVAFDLDTPLAKLESEIMNNFDVVLLMGVPAGFGGQEFNPKVLSKLKELATRKKESNSTFRICLDGGQTLETIGQTAYAGADEVVVGKRLFEGDVSQNIQEFHQASLKTN